MKKADTVEVHQGDANVSPLLEISLTNFFIGNVHVQVKIVEEWQSSSNLIFVVLFVIII